MEKKYSEWFWDPFDSDEFSFHNKDKYRKKKDKKTFIVINKDNNNSVKSYVKNNEPNGYSVEPRESINREREGSGYNDTISASQYREFYASDMNKRSKMVNNSYEAPLVGNSYGNKSHINEFDAVNNSNMVPNRNMVSSRVNESRFKRT